MAPPIANGCQQFPSCIYENSAETQRKPTDHSNMTSLEVPTQFDMAIIGHNTLFFQSDWKLTGLILEDAI